jgi:hypothetical protein
MTLKELSQHTFMNAFYTVMFGAHNTTGIHGACAIDILHTIWACFYVFGTVFSYKLGRRLLVRMSLMPLLGSMVVFARQSDRNMPKSKFNVGITGGKLMAKSTKVFCFYSLLLCGQAQDQDTTGYQSGQL